MNQGETILAVAVIGLGAWYVLGGSSATAGTAAGQTAATINPQTGQSAPAGYVWEYNPQTGRYQLVANGSFSGYGAPVTSSSVTFPPAAAPNGYYYARSPSGAYVLTPNSLGGAYGEQQSIFSALSGAGAGLGNFFKSILGGSTSQALTSSAGPTSVAAYNFSPIASDTGLPNTDSLFGDSTGYSASGYVPPTQSVSNNGLNYDVGALPQNYSSDLNIPGLSLSSASGSYSGYSGTSLYL